MSEFVDYVSNLFRPAIATESLMYNTSLVVPELDAAEVIVLAVGKFQR